MRKAAEQISFLLKYNPTESSIDMNESRSQMELENYQKALIKSVSRVGLYVETGV